MFLFDCCLDPETDFQTSMLPEIIMFDVSASIVNEESYCSQSEKTDSEDGNEKIMQEVITHIELFLPINIDYCEETGLYKPTPIRKRPIENLMHHLDYPISTHLYKRRFESGPQRGAILNSVIGNLVEDSSGQRIEFFNCVKRSDPIPIDHTNTYL